MDRSILNGATSGILLQRTQHPSSRSGKSDDDHNRAENHGFAENEVLPKLSGLLPWCG